MGGHFMRGHPVGGHSRVDYSDKGAINNLTETIDH